MLGFLLGESPIFSWMNSHLTWWEEKRCKLEKLCPRKRPFKHLHPKIKNKIRKKEKRYPGTRLRRRRRRRLGEDRPAGAREAAASRRAQRRGGGRRRVGAGGRVATASDNPAGGKTDYLLWDFLGPTLQSHTHTHPTCLKTSRSLLAHYLNKIMIFG